MAAEAAADILEGVEKSPHFEALVAIARRRIGIERGEPTQAADVQIARIAAQIEATPDLREDASLRAFARLAGSLLEGDGARRDQVWNDLAALAPALVKRSAEPIAEKRLALFDTAVERLKAGEIRLADVADAAGLSAEMRERLRQTDARMARILDGDVANDAQKETRDDREGWELRALRGTLTPEEALRLARIDPNADDRTREQHRRSLADGGLKAVIALMAALHLRKAAQQAELSLGLTAGRMDALAETNRAIADVGAAMKASGWEVPAMPDAAPEPGRGEETIADTHRRRSGGQER